MMVSYALKVKKREDMIHVHQDTLLNTMKLPFSLMLDKISLENYMCIFRLCQKDVNWISKQCFLI